MKIWVNCIVNNEENFIWFAINSVLKYVDKILVWDTGSTDGTVEIIKQIKSDKIEFREIGKVDADEFTKMRQEMLKQSVCDWVLILDGDEIWWDASISQLISRINKNNSEGIVVPMKVAVGDIYHLQDEEAGQYHLLGRKGHLSLKAFSKKIPGLHVDWPYGKEGFFDGDGKLIQEREKIIFLDTPFLHVTHLRRSALKREYNKFKYEIGEKVSDNFKFPEVFYNKFPSFVPSPWVKIGALEKFKSRLVTPLRKMKRRIYG